MPTFKYTMIFVQTTDPTAGAGINGREAGWSESWYTDANSVADAIAKGRQPGGLLMSRALMLCNTAAIVEQRVQQVGNVGPSQIVRQRFTGIQGRCDVPQMSLAFLLISQGGNSKRKISLRGIPDDAIKGGAYNPSVFFDQAINAYLIAIQAWAWPVQSPSVAKFAVASINALGLVTLSGANPYAVGNILHFTRLKPAGNGSVIRGDWTVESVGPGSNQFSIAGWNGGIVSGGSVTLVTRVYVQPSAALSKNFVAALRKVGRPFDPYRGRVSAK